MVMEVVQEDMGDGSMHCTYHPYKNSTPGGICAFCLQEKLGKLVASSFPVAVFPSSSPSSSSPSLTSSSNLAANPPQMPFNSTTQGRNKKKDGNLVLTAASSDASSIVFKRSKSTTNPRRGNGMHFLDANDDSEDYNSPHKKGFWSFLYLSKHSTSKKGERSFNKDVSSYGSSVSSSMRSREKKKEELDVVDENDDESSPDDQASSFDRKVSRSRSVGCGSRSFSGDFFERISTGFGDCTLRRVESQREGNKPKVASIHGEISCAGQDCIKESVKCGGIFSGFMITSSSSYWISSSTHEDNGYNGGRLALTPAHGRSKSWGWAFASPMRAFGKPSSNNGKREASSNKNNATPNLSAIPSLLTVRG